MAKKTPHSTIAPGVKRSQERERMAMKVAADKTKSTKVRKAALVLAKAARRTLDTAAKLRGE